MSIHITNTTSISSDILQELVFQSLDRIIGSSHTIITGDLPYPGQHILALDQDKQPTLISYDLHDSGRALLSGLSAMDGLVNNRSWLYRLYPALFSDKLNQNAALRIGDIKLAILSPEPIPGNLYIAMTMPNISMYTFQTLDADNNIGLLIEPLHEDKKPEKTKDTLEDIAFPQFREGVELLNEEEEAFFQAASL